MNDGLIVHEWIARSGGSEKVLAAFSHAFPDTRIVCLWNDTDSYPNRVTETWLARTPLRRSKALALPFMPMTWRRVPANNVSWMLISSHLFAHHAHVRQSTHARKLVYVHTPARYIWNPELDQRGASAPVRAAAPLLRSLDRKRAREGAKFAANSEFVRTRIQSAWDVDARVIYPPVDVAHIQSNSDWRQGLNSQDEKTIASLPEEFLLGASRFVSYKQLQEVIRAGSLTDLPVVLAGSGPMRAQLKSMAAEEKVRVVFVDDPSSELLYALYQQCLAYLFPPIEDFGIMPVEAMAAGAPVVANRIGGAAESIVDGRTGFLVDFSSPSDLVAAVTAATSLDPADSMRRAVTFDSSRFQAEIKSWVVAESA